jgi:hypothetical protein
MPGDRRINGRNDRVFARNRAEQYLDARSRRLARLDENEAVPVRDDHDSLACSRSGIVEFFQTADVGHHPGGRFAGGGNA